MKISVTSTMRSKVENMEKKTRHGKIISIRKEVVGGVLYVVGVTWASVHAPRNMIKLWKEIWSEQYTRDQVTQMTSFTSPTIITTPPGTPTIHPPYIKYWMDMNLQSKVYVYIYNIGISTDVTFAISAIYASQTLPVKASYHWRERYHQNWNFWAVPCFWPDLTHLIGLNPDNFFRSDLTTTSCILFFIWVTEFESHSSHAHRWKLTVLRYHSIRVNDPYSFLGVKISAILHDFIRENYHKNQLDNYPFPSLW